MATRLELFHEVLSTTFPKTFAGERAAPHPQTTVVIFADVASYAPFRPVIKGRASGNITGHFQSSAEVNYIAISGVAGHDKDAFPALAHEYIHLLVSRYFRGAPLWFKEGIAEYYSTAKLSGDRMTLGGPIKTHQLLLRAGPPIPIADLLEVNESSPYYLENGKRALLYAESWALVHYLLNGSTDERRSQFGRYLELLSTGSDDGASFRRAFGTSVQNLEAELAAYVRLPSYPERIESIGKRPSTDVMFDSVPLAETQTAAHLGDMLLRAGRDNEAEAYLRQALDANAGLAAAHVSLGVIRLRQNRYDDAKQLLRRAAALDPRDHLAHFHLAETLRREGVAGVVSAADFDEKTRVIREQLKRTIELRPDFIEAYKVLAWVDLERSEQVGEAATLLETAIGLAPRRRELRLLLAQARIRTGEFAAARELVESTMLRGGDARMIAQAEKLLALIASKEAAARKPEVDPSIGSTANTPTQPCDMPEVGGAYHKRLRFKGQQVCGQLMEIECTDDGTVLSVETGGRRLRLRAQSLNRVRFVTYTTAVRTGQLECGPRTPANPVLVTFRPMKDATSTVDGEIIAVEFVPSDWNQ